MRYLAALIPVFALLAACSSQPKEYRPHRKAIRLKAIVLFAETLTQRYVTGRGLC